MSLFHGLFGCPHRKTTFPRTRLAAAGIKETYMVCLDCAKEIPYNWARMRVGRTRQPIETESRCASTPLPSGMPPDPANAATPAAKALS